MTVTKKDLVDQLAEQQHYTKKAASQLIDDFVDIIMYNLQEGNAVAIQNFGTFDLLLRADHGAKHPLTGEFYPIPEHYVPRFYPSKAMRTVVKIYDDSRKRGMV